MEKTLFDRNGKAVAYLTDDYNQTIYLWEGMAIAYLFDERHLFGINGKHLGWFIDGVVYDHKGERVGFSFATCPVAVTKEPIRPKKHPSDEIRPRWSAPPLPKLSYQVSEQSLADFLKEGQAYRFRKEVSTEGSEDKE